MITKHYSVLKNETVDNLNIKENGVYVDATVGYAGHAKEILAKCKKGFLFAFDEDSNAVEYSTQVLSNISDNFMVCKENFVNLKEVLNKQGVNNIDGIIFDLGFSSPQIDDESRGFSFMKNATLDMRMDKDIPINAKDSLILRI